MSKKHRQPIEARWRWHRRRMRMLANFHDELWHLSDPLEVVRKAQRSGAIARLEIAVRDEAEFFGSLGLGPDGTPTDPRHPFNRGG